MNDSGMQGMCESTPYCFPQRTRKSLNIFPASPIAPIYSSSLNRTHNDSLFKNTSFVSSLDDKPSVSEFYINHQASLQKTPIKNISGSKLGSPERNEIISGRRPTPVKWITPKSDRSSPAKKNLFGLHLSSGGSVRKNKSLLAQHIKHDPMVFFLHKRNVEPVVKKILSYLNDVDLYNCKRVSQSWRSAIQMFPAMRDVVDEFEIKMEGDKENPERLKNLYEAKDLQQSVDSEMPQSDIFIELAQTLNENQSLRRCPLCEQPQIVECNIGQCQNIACRYICCLKCGSYSIDGPEHFNNTCNSGKLQTGCKRRTLMDSPPHSQLSFFSSSNDNSYLYASDQRDSCYGTYDESKFGSCFSISASDKSNSINRSASHGPNDSTFGRLLGNLNCNGDSNNKSQYETNLRKQAPYKKLYTPVVRTSSTGTATRPKTPEDSPVKDYRGACTKASKQRLKRLLR